jgi:hypothetical protein
MTPEVVGQQRPRLRLDRIVADIVTVANDSGVAAEQPKEHIEVVLQEVDHPKIAGKTLETGIGKAVTNGPPMGLGVVMQRRDQVLPWWRQYSGLLQRRGD